MVSSAELYGPRRATFNCGVCIRKGGQRIHSKKGCICPGDTVLTTTEEAIGVVAHLWSTCLSKHEALGLVPSTHKIRLGGIYLRSPF